jgi:hypothetical protein
VIDVHIGAQLDDFKFKLANSLLIGKLNFKLANPLLKLTVALRQFTDSLPTSSASASTRCSASLRATSKSICGGFEAIGGGRSVVL